jgi:very-short-patch-repair endonuclease
VGEARRRGISRRRLRALDFEKPFHGIRVAAKAVTFLDDHCRAFLPRMPRGGVYSHVTAARLYRIPLPLRLSTSRELHVSVPRTRRAVDARGIVGHRVTLSADDWDNRFGFPVTTPERTWCDLASVLTLPELVAAGDKLIARRLPQTTRAALERAVSAYPSRRGIRNLRRALTLLSDRAESPRESLLRVAIVLAGLPEPKVNMRVFSSKGKFLARVDLCYPHLKLTLEYQGDHHRTDATQWRRDIARTRAMQADEWTQLQYTQADLDDPTRFLEELRAMLVRLAN